MFFFEVLLRNQGGTRAVSLRNNGGITADMAIPLCYHCGLVAVPRRSLAAGLRCWWKHCGTSEVPLQGWRCYCGGAAAPGRLHDVRAAAMGWVVLGPTVLSAAEDVATVITVITYYYYYCL